MYEKLKRYFLEEIKNDKIINLPVNFYDEVREYAKNISDNVELERLKYYFRELRKLRIYKAMYLDDDKDNLLKEELDIIRSIEGFELEDLKIKPEKLEKSPEIEIPKLIYTINDIDVVKVERNFPQFTDGSFIYDLNKNDVLSINKRISNILEKHRIISKIRP